MKKPQVQPEIILRGGFPAQLVISHIARIVSRRRRIVPEGYSGRIGESLDSIVIPDTVAPAQSPARPEPQGGILAKPASVKRFFGNIPPRRYGRENRPTIIGTKTGRTVGTNGTRQVILTLIRILYPAQVRDKGIDRFAGKVCSCSSRRDPGSNSSRRIDGHLALCTRRDIGYQVVLETTGRNIEHINVRLLHGISAQQVEAMFSKLSVIV